MSAHLSSLKYSCQPTLSARQQAADSSRWQPAAHITLKIAKKYTKVAKIVNNSYNKKCFLETTQELCMIAQIRRKVKKT